MLDGGEMDKLKDLKDIDKVNVMSYHFTKFVSQQQKGSVYCFVLSFTVKDLSD